MAQSREAREQQVIDHQVLLSRTREIIHDYVAGQQGRTEARDSLQQSIWIRRQIADMIARSTPDELDALGLTDDMMRELRLGTSVQAAWEALHPPPLPISTAGIQPVPGV